MKSCKITIWFVNENLNAGYSIQYCNEDTSNQYVIKNMIDALETKYELAYIQKIDIEECKSGVVIDE
jgi:hypothetical protein